MRDTWTVGRLLTWGTDYLQKSGSASPRLDAQLLVGHVTGLDKVQLYVQFERPLVSGELATLRELLRRRATGEPVAYILGKKEFYGRELIVGPGVLVPRPETEHLVDTVLEHLKAHGGESPRAVDVGTGSGAIAVTLAAELPDLVVVGTDISPAALIVAAQNAEALDVRDRVKLARGDTLEPIRNAASVDAVVSNPPYLADAAMAALPRDVRDHEPHLALHGGPDGLDVIRRLLAGAARVLRPGGLVALEVSDSAQATRVADLLAESGAFEPARIIEDYQGLGRVVRAVRRAE